MLCVMSWRGDERQRPHRRERDRDGADRDREPPRAPRPAGERTAAAANSASTIATTTCDIADSAMQQRGQPRPLAGVERLAERAEREQAERERERERELAGERARDVAAVDLPVVARLHEHAGRRDRERRRRGPRCPQAARERVRARGEQQRARTP